jgi:hypothetical protein
MKMAGSDPGHCRFSKQPVVPAHAGTHDHGRTLCGTMKLPGGTRIAFADARLSRTTGTLSARPRDLVLVAVQFEDIGTFPDR